MSKFHEETLLLLISHLPRHLKGDISCSCKLFFNYVSELDDEDKKLLAESSVLDEFFSHMNLSLRFIDYLYRLSPFDPSSSDWINNDDIMNALKNRVIVNLMENSNSKVFEKIYYFGEKRSIGGNKSLYGEIFSQEVLLKSKKYKKYVLKQALKD